jgi:hypothetical protein
MDAKRPETESSPKKFRAELNTAFDRAAPVVPFPPRAAEAAPVRVARPKPARPHDFAAGGIFT